MFFWSVIFSSKSYFKHFTRSLTSGYKVKSFEELPENCQNYLKVIEDYLKVNVTIFSVGPDRLQTVTLKKIF